MKTLIVWLSLAAAAVAQTERKPNGDFENAFPRWSPSAFGDVFWYSDVEQSYETLDQMAVVIDRRGTIHAAARRLDPTTNRHLSPSPKLTAV